MVALLSVLLFFIGACADQEVPLPAEILPLVKGPDAALLTPPLIHLPRDLVTPGCLACMCQAMSGCTPGCVGDTCGLFRLTWAFWADAGKPVLPGMTADHLDAYRSCSEDFGCATIAIQNYMRKFAQDCNGDGVINCHDYMALHTQGGYACKNNIPLRFLGHFDQCIIDSISNAIVI